MQYTIKSLLTLFMGGILAGILNKWMSTLFLTHFSNCEWVLYSSLTSPTVNEYFIPHSLLQLWMSTLFLTHFSNCAAEYQMSVAWFSQPKFRCSYDPFSLWCCCMWQNLACSLTSQSMWYRRQTRCWMPPLSGLGTSVCRPLSSATLARYQHMSPWTSLRECGIMHHGYTSIQDRRYLYYGCITMLSTGCGYSPNYTSKVRCQ